MPSLEEDLAARVARGEEIVLATVIKVDGEPPSHAGAKILLSRTATLSGTLGCSEFDSAALADAGYRALAPYLRGYGPTRFVAAAATRMAQQAAIGQDLLDFIDALALPRVALAGGGLVACRHPL